MQHYIRFIKKCVEFYEPDGVGYDMNWQVHKEIVKLQAEIYRWLQREYPDEKKWVIVDYGFGTPSQLYADALISEFGPVQYGFPENPVYESTMALRTGWLNLLTFAHFNDILTGEGKLKRWSLRRVKVKTREELHELYLDTLLKGLALGATWMDMPWPFIAPEDVDAWKKLGFTRKEGYSFPRLLKLKELAAFSARATGTPIVTDSNAVTAHPDLKASAWADARSLLVAAYRHRVSWHPEPGFYSPQEEARTSLPWVRLDRRVLQRHGLRRVPTLRAVVLGKDGLPKARADWSGTGEKAVHYPNAPEGASDAEPLRLQVAATEEAIEIRCPLSEGQLLLVFSPESD